LEVFTTYSAFDKVHLLLDRCKLLKKLMNLFRL
jgi:hypothetical protein